MSTYGSPPPGDVVTGEAVALELRLAQMPTRALGLFIDMAIQISVLFLLLLALLAAGGSLDSTAGAALALVVTVSVIVGYPLALETLTRGKTVGKYAFGLRAVRDDGGAIRFRHALARALVEVVEIWILFGVPAFFCSLINPKGKRFGDLAAGTVVIRERVPSESGVRSEMPPEFAAWASATDVGRVPDDLALACRQFLVRAPSLDPQVRWSMSRRLATDVMPWLAPAPPPGSTPERLLAAVVAERRRREQQRMAQTTAATQAWASAQQPQPIGAAPPQPAPPASSSWVDAPTRSSMAPAPAPTAPRHAPPPEPSSPPDGGGFAAPG